MSVLNEEGREEKSRQKYRPPMKDINIYAVLQE